MVDTCVIQEMACEAHIEKETLKKPTMEHVEMSVAEDMLPDFNCNVNLQAGALSVKSGSETFFQTPEQSLEEEEKQGLTTYLEKLLLEQEVVKEGGLELAFGLLEVEIERVRREEANLQVERLVEQGEEVKLEKSGTTGVSRLPMRAQTTLRRPASPLVPPTGKAINSLVAVPRHSSPLLLARSPTTLGATKVLTIPMYREPNGPDCSLHAPIGMCVLNTGEIVVASTFDDNVKMFSPDGKFLGLVFPKGFKRPSDMVALR